MSEVSSRLLAEQLGLDGLRVEAQPGEDLIGSPFRVTDAAVSSVGAAVAAVRSRPVVDMPTEPHSAPQRQLGPGIGLETVYVIRISHG